MNLETDDESVKNLCSRVSLKEPPKSMMDQFEVEVIHKINKPVPVGLYLKLGVAFIAVGLIVFSLNGLMANRMKMAVEIKGPVKIVKDLSHHSNAAANHADELHTNAIDAVYTDSPVQKVFMTKEMKLLQMLGEDEELVEELGLSDVDMEILNQNPGSPASPSI